ncbi:MAG: hypothetical protein WC450_11690 [Candidatus Omnitrophota bacterium]|jgi:hypothetical protein
MGNHGASDDFGKDHNLMTEVIVTGRKVGAGKRFYSALAEDVALFRKVVEFTEAEKIRMSNVLWDQFYREVFGITVNFFILTTFGAEAAAEDVLKCDKKCFNDRTLEMLFDLWKSGEPLYINVNLCLCSRSSCGR